MAVIRVTFGKSKYRFYLCCDLAGKETRCRYCNAPFASRHHSPNCLFLAIPRVCDKPGHLQPGNWNPAERSIEFFDKNLPSLTLKHRFNRDFWSSSHSRNLHSKLNGNPRYSKNIDACKYLSHFSAKRECKVLNKRSRHCKIRYDIKRWDIRMEKGIGKKDRRLSNELEIKISFEKINREIIFLRFFF